MTTPQAAVAHVRDALRTLDTAQQRAAFLTELTYLVHDHAKYRSLDVEEPDGLTPERRSLRAVVVQVEEHWASATHPLHHTTAGPTHS